MLVLGRAVALEIVGLALLKSLCMSKSVIRGRGGRLRFRSTFSLLNLGSLSSFRSLIAFMHHAVLTETAERALQTPGKQSRGLKEILAKSTKCLKQVSQITSQEAGQRRN